MRDAQRLRAQAKKARAALSTQKKQAYSEQIKEQLLTLCAQAKWISLYRAMAQEVDLRSLFPALWQQGKQTALPICRDRGVMDMALYHAKMPLALNRYGIEEPMQAEIIRKDRLDVIVVPLVAFDAQGHRLGHGSGYYDRYLADARAVRIGVAFSCQQVEQITPLPHDIAMDLIITETGVRRFAPMPR